MQRLRASFVLASLLTPVLAGCAERMGDVHGKIVFEGQPVPVGSVLFAPKGGDDEWEVGRPATGTPDADGAFQLSTHRRNDGAAVGTYHVIFTPPQPPESADPGQQAVDLKLYLKYGHCRLPEGYELDVKPGRNDFVLELQRAERAD